jgi:anti-sigma factor RsiW
VDCHESRRVLGAFADNELSPAEATAVRDHVEGCATCRHRLSSLELLGSIVRRVPYHAAPAALRARIASTRKRTWRMPSVMQWAAAVIIVASVAGGGLVVSRRATDTRAAIAEALIDDHVRALMGEHLLDVVSSDQHTVKPWFAGKLDFSPPVVDLEPIGFPLAGGRVEYVSGRPAAALIYRHRLHTISLFIWPATDEARSIDARSIRGFQVRHWTRGGMAFWAVSDLNDAELETFAQALQR